jgi:cell division protein FtsB
MLRILAIMLALSQVAAVSVDINGVPHVCHTIPAEKKIIKCIKESPLKDKKINNLTQQNKVLEDQVKNLLDQKSVLTEKIETLEPKWYEHPVLWFGVGVLTTGLTVYLVK